MLILGCADSRDALHFWGCVEDTCIQTVTDITSLASHLSASPAPRAIVVRLTPPASEGAALVAQARQLARNLPIVAWTPEITSEEAFRLSHLGPDALVTDSATPSQRAQAIYAARSLALGASDGDTLAEQPWRRHLVGNGSSMRMVCELIRLVSQRRCTVLITGETGSGKEMVAKAIHAASPRASQPLVSINCNAIPNDLLEAELFGHVKGAYTGAFQSRVGRFEQANRGTLFLDEIGDLPFPLQAKLLRVLQEREIQRLGSSETVNIDVRVIAATNANLHRLVQEGKFRQDLYYRLHVAPIQVPALRERLEDIPVLVNHFVEKICRNEQIPVKTVPREVTAWLQTMPWPGNVRELENTVESAIAISGDRPSLKMSDFPLLLGNGSQQPCLFAMPSEGIDYNAVVSRFERTLLTEALRLTGGSKKRAAALLQLKRTTFSAKLDALEDGNEMILDELEEPLAVPEALAAAGGAIDSSYPY